MKKILLVFISFLLLFSLVACNNSEDNKNSAKQQSYNWEEIQVYDLLPQPNSENGKILTNDYDYLEINIFDITIEDYQSYISACKDFGFEIYENDNEDGNTYECEGYNKYHSELDISYDSERKTMNLQFDAEVEKNPLKWSNSELAQMLPIPEATKGYIDADREEKYEVVLMDVSVADFNSYKDLCIDKGFTLDAKSYSSYYKAKNENGYQVTIEYGDKEMGITIILPEDEQ